MGMGMGMSSCLSWFGCYVGTILNGYLCFSNIMLQVMESISWKLSSWLKQKRCITVKHFLNQYQPLNACDVEFVQLACDMM